MKLTTDERSEIKGYLGAMGLTLEDAARLVECHRTTISKKLAGDLEITPCDFLNLGRAIERQTSANAA